MPFFDVLRFQPFKEAVAYGNLVEQYFDGVFPLMLFQELNYDAGYQVRCGTEEQSMRRRTDGNMMTNILRAASLTDLLTAVAEAFEAGVFCPNDAGELETNERLGTASSCAVIQAGCVLRTHYCIANGGN